jgi:excisionase family DNA binding protein
MNVELPEGQMVFTLNEVAAYLKTTTWTLRRWISKNELRAHKVGQQWRVHREELWRQLTDPSRQVQSEASMVMPDDIHGIRRPWLGLMESRDMAEFVALRVVKMALDREDVTAIVPLLEGFTGEEMRAYRAALAEVLSLTDRVIGQQEPPYAE